VSAQIIAGLRRRAGVLEDEAQQQENFLAGAAAAGFAAGTNRPPGLLQFRAAEFRAMADEAEGGR
jgi:hypothetical protein